MKLNSFKVGVIAFLIVLFLMPFGHALMVLNERVLVEHKYLGAFSIGVLGLIMLTVGIVKNEKNALATILGLLGGILVWTGWIEFSFMWIAEKLEIPGLVENGEVVTNPEYLVMMSSLGLLLAFILLFLFTQNRCTFFNWFQHAFKLKKHLKLSDAHFKPLAMITFIETIMLLWTFYIVLLLVYDKDIAGDDHPATYIVAFGSLFWSFYLMLKLIKISKLDYAIRYAIPTVIIFWNFVEVIGRWNLFKEIWVHPLEHWFENLLILAMLVGFIAFYFYENRAKEAKRKKLKMEVGLE
ncbi:MAG: hypothetical protein KF872_09880 [Chitinophagales bacterium]|nr:hypothetical protein [Chitinophagales bacterium]